MDTTQRTTYDRIMNEHGRPSFRPGEPMRCRPSNAELRGDEPRRAPHANDGRVIFDSEDQARAAIAELHEAGARFQEPFQCPRSKSGHWHIRTAAHAHHATAHQDGDPPR